MSVCAAALIGGSVGCETNGFLDPSEVGRYNKKPLVVPILDRVDASVEEVNAEFASATDPTPEDLVTDARDYTISPNDLLQITISDLQVPNVDTIKNARVSETGNVSLPFLETPVPAEGRTEIELEQVIVQAYRDAKIVERAQVSVTVIEARGRAFSILGAVNAPGQYAIIDSDFRMLDALVLARDTISPLQEYAFIIRKPAKEGAADGSDANTKPAETAPSSDDLEPQSTLFAPGYSRKNRGQAKAVLLNVLQDAPPDEAIDPSGRVTTIEGQDVAAPKVETDATPAPKTAESAEPFEFESPMSEKDTRIIRVPIKALKEGDLRYNVAIRAKDTIILPTVVIGEYYMGGHINRPGAYSLTGRKITLKQAVDAAGGLDALAIPQRTEIIRRIGPREEIFVRLDLAAVFNGSQPDIFLKPDDQVRVGTNAFAPFLAALRGAFRITYGFGFLYDRNYAYTSDRQLN